MSFAALLYLWNLLQQVPSPPSTVTLTPQQLILSVLSILLGGGAFTALLNGFFNRRKLDGDTVKVIGEAASGVVRNLREDNEDLRARQNTLERQLRQLQDQLDDQARDHRRELAAAEARADHLVALIRRHADWDQQVVDYLRNPTRSVPGDPPPLTIPD